MPTRSRPAMYNTPAIRNGGFGALQVEALTNRPLSIARRHFAASQLRMRDIEPDELSSSEWVRFLVMEDTERERWMTQFVRRRRNSDESTSSADVEREAAYGKAEEVRAASQAATASLSIPAQTSTSNSSRPTQSTGQTPAVSLWVRQLDNQTDNGDGTFTARQPRHTRRDVANAEMDAPPTYATATRARTPPPAYVPRNGGRDRSDSNEAAIAPNEVTLTTRMI